MNQAIIKSLGFKRIDTSIEEENIEWILSTYGELGHTYDRLNGINTLFSRKFTYLCMGDIYDAWIYIFKYKHSWRLILDSWDNKNVLRIKEKSDINGKGTDFEYLLNNPVPKGW